MTNVVVAADRLQDRDAQSAVEYLNPSTPHTGKSALRGENVRRNVKNAVKRKITAPARLSNYSNFDAKQVRNLSITRPPMQSPALRPRRAKRRTEKF